MELGALGAAILFWAVLMGLVGYLLGNTRGRGGEGALFGILLGPLGWIIVLLLPSSGNKCPECLGTVPAGARRCQHCGVVFSRPIPQTQASDLARFFVIVNEKAEGPFSIAQLRILISSKKLTPETLCAREGDSQWVPLSDFL